MKKMITNARALGVDIPKRQKKKTSFEDIEDLIGNGSHTNRMTLLMRIMALFSRISCKFP